MTWVKLSCATHESPVFGCPECIAAATQPGPGPDDAPDCPGGCGPLLTPIEMMSRDDVAAFMSEEHGHNVWCPCCGETFKAEEDIAQIARLSFEAYEATL